MAGTENPYEPKLKQAAQPNEQVEEQQNEEPAALDYTRVMNDGTQTRGDGQMREAQPLIERPPVTEFKDPEIQKAFTLSSNAASAAQLVRILESGQADNTSTGLVDSQGREISIGRLKQALIDDLRKNSEFKEFGDAAKLREYVGQTTEAALDISKNAREKYEAASRASDTNLNARNDLAKELGFPGKTHEVVDSKGAKTTITTYDVTAQDIQARLARSTNEQEKASLQKLSGLLANNDSIQKERHALTMVDVAAAQLMMGGLTHKAGEKPLEGQPSTREEVMRSYQILQQAGRMNPMMEQAPQFKEVKEQAANQYAGIQQERSRDAVLALQAADKARTDGKPVEEVTKLYEEALKKAKDIDMASIRSNMASQEREFLATKQKFDALADTPENQQQRLRLAQELQGRQDIALQLAQIMQVNKEAKVQYATYLNEQGKTSEALPLLASAVSETPEFCTPDKDPTFQEQFEKAQNIATLNSGDMDKHRILYDQALASKDWATAERELGILKAASLKQSETAIGGIKNRLEVFDKRKAELDAELTSLKANETMDAQAKQIREEQIANEKKGYEELEKPLKELLPKMEEETRIEQNKMAYFQAVLLNTRGDKEAAHKIFKQLEADAPEIANNKDMQLAEYIEDSREKGTVEKYFDTAVGYLKIGAAVAAAGAAIFFTAGAATPLVIAAAAGAGAAGYFSMGAAGHLTAKALDYKSTDNYNNWRPLDDLKTGAMIGGAMGGAHVLFAGGGMAAGGTRLVALGEASTSRLASTALTYTGRGLQLGADLGKLTTLPNAAKAAGVWTTGHQGYEMAFNGKSLQDAALDGSMEFVGTTAGLYGAGKFKGNFNSLGGPLAFGAGLSGGHEAANVAFHGKDATQGLKDWAWNGVQYSTYAYGAGVFSKMNAIAATRPLTMSTGSAFTAPFRGAAPLTSLTREAAGNGMFYGTLGVVGATPVALNGIQDYQDRQSRIPVEFSAMTDPQRQMMTSFELDKRAQRFQRSRLTVQRDKP